MSALRTLLQLQTKILTQCSYRPVVSCRPISCLAASVKDENRNINFKGRHRSVGLKKELLLTWSVTRGYAKKANVKATKKGKKDEKHVNVSTEDLMEVLDTEKMESEMRRILEDLKEDYIRTLKLRTSVAAFESVVVETDDGRYPLNQLGQIVLKNPQLILVNLASYPQFVKNVKMALENSGMNINPQADGSTVAVPIPKITKEHREKLVKSAKKMNDDAKVKLRTVRQKYSKKVAACKKTHSSDVCASAETIILNTLHEVSKAADELMEKKQTELLKS